MFKISQEKRKEILEFYWKYKDLFDENTQYMFNEFSLGNDLICDTLFEFYTYFHAIADSINPYYV